MIGFGCVSLAIVVAVAIELVVSGRPLYHAGWYNVGLAALVAVTLVNGRKRFRRTSSPRARWGIVAGCVGAAVLGLAGIASGLLAPDNQTVVGAPGERVRVESVGTLSFPLATLGAQAGAVTLQRRVGGRIEIGERPRNAGNFILRAVERDVAYVEARDLRGNRLTITQPSGSVFLSPVLLMQHRQTIAGMNLPYDSFNVPAVRRVVKAVLFTPDQAAMFARSALPRGRAAVLLAVDDENERPLPNAIVLSAGDRAVTAGGLSLRAAVARYPAVEVVAAPNSLATVLGTLLVLGGLLSLISRPTLLAGDDRSDVSDDDAALRKLDAFGR